MKQPNALDDVVDDAGSDEFFLSDKTEIGEAFDNLDKDITDPNTQMSTIDLNARLSDMEVKSIMIFDTFVRLGIFPESWGLTRQIKRLSVSRDGEGRKEKVKIASASMMRKADSMGGGFLGGLFQRKEQ